MDRPNNLMIIDSIMWLKGQPDWDAVKEVIQERMVDRFPAFSSVAVRKDDGYVWEQDAEFDLDNHVRFAPLEDPYIEDVRAFVASQRSVPLPTDRPLWQFYLIPGVTDDAGNDLGAVILSRIHHAIADGVRLVQVTLGLCDPVDGDAGVEATVGKGRAGDPDMGKPSLAEFTKQKISGTTGLVRDQVTKVASAAANPVGTLRDTLSDSAGVLDDALNVAGDPGRLIDAFSAFAPIPDDATNTLASVAKLGLSGRSVDTIWSGTPGVEKTAEWVDAMSLDKIKEIGQRTGTTVNDVLLAMVAGTLQQYLAEHDASVDDVMWMIPVSIKPFDPGMPKELGNHFALIAFPMPLNIDDPKQRLFEINRRINRIKNSKEAVITFGVQRAISQTPERLGVFLTNFFANKAVGVLTNVPGPRSEIALAGTPVEAMLGWAPSSGDQPMTICMFTYNGRVHVGFGTDESLVPDSQRLPEIFVDEARGLYSAITGKNPAI
jgi:diacylglycerol O-acyltransferase